MRRIALITESSQRRSNQMPAYLYYQGKHSRWVNHIIRYMEVRKFQREDAFFLSFYKQQIIPYQQEIGEYPKRKGIPTAAAKKEFSRKILEFLLTYNEPVFVEIHAGKDISVPLSKLLIKYKLPYKIYSDGEPLGNKHKEYEKLIQLEEENKRFKSIQKDKWKLIGMMEYNTPHELSFILERYEHKGQLFGVEDLFEELKQLLQKYREKEKASLKARSEFEEQINQTKEADRLMNFLNNKNSIPSLLKDIETYQKMKKKFGKEIAKYTRYLIKKNYQTQIENKINETMDRLQIVLLK